MGIAAIALCLCAVMGAVRGAAYAQNIPAIGADPKSSLPFIFKADKLAYDQENGLVIATGSVEVVQGDRILLADRLIYDRNTNTVTADGNVVMMAAEKETVFADRAQLTGDLGDGVIEGMRLRLSDDSRIAAAGGRRSGGFRTEMRKVVYSPCKLCKKDPTRAPIWQLKAIKVVHDEVSKEIEYSDAWLEFYGIPVLYMPYLSHPDPSVKRRTGFLTPSYGSDSVLGVVVRMPFYISIAPNIDATLTPIVTSSEGGVLAAEYRHLFSHARLETKGSVTRARVDTAEEEFRGHFFLDAGVDFSNAWRTKLQIAVTSDDTYLRRYSFDSRDTLVNHGRVEGFWERSYMAVNGYAFQGLRAEDDQDRIPFVAPLFDFNYVSDPGIFGSVWKFDSNLMVLTRTEGTDSRRLSVKGGWETPYISPLGDVYRFYASAAADGYWVVGQPDSSEPDGKFTGLTGRLFPHAGIDWRFPFVRQGEKSSQTIEPMAGVIFAPNTGSQSQIPNEDSLDLELDDTNVFEANRYNGIDRVEGGNRVYYGLRAAHYGKGATRISLFLGQTYRFRDDPSIPEDTGIENNLSDIVGRAEFVPFDWVSALYRFRLDTDFGVRRHEVESKLGTKRFNINTEYVFIERPESLPEFNDREEVTVSAFARLTEQWSVAGGFKRDLSRAGGQLFEKARITYKDDCLTFSVEFVRKFFSDRDLEPSDSVFFRVNLRTLGGFQADTGIGGGSGE